MSPFLPLILGTRGSALALAQTALVRAAFATALPVEIREIKTTGDKRQDLSLTHVTPSGHGYETGRPGEKVDPGVFTRELEAALLAGEIDAAVHSLKDLPTAMPAGLVLAAVLPRADTADMLIFKHDSPTSHFSPLTSHFPLPTAAVVATSSLRRQRQLLFHRPDLRVVEVRGNVGTRLAKLAANADWSALVLARAGLERLGHGEALRAGFLETGETGARFGVEILGPDVMLPAVGQGAIGLQCRADDAPTRRALAAVNHEPTWTAITAERALLELLGGGCQLPLGVATELRGRGPEATLRLRAIWFRAAGEEAPRRAQAIGTTDRPRAVAEAVAEKLRVER